MERQHSGSDYQVSTSMWTCGKAAAGRHGSTAAGLWVWLWLWLSLWLWLVAVAVTVAVACGPAVGLLWACWGPAVWTCCQPAVGLLWACCGPAVGLLWTCCQPAVGLLWACCGPVILMSFDVTACAYCSDGFSGHR
jgi:hypothetical protein